MTNEFEIHAVEETADEGQIREISLVEMDEVSGGCWEVIRAIHKGIQWFVSAGDGVPAPVK